MKKGGIEPAAVVVLLAMLGTIIFYVIEVTPSEREALIETVEYSNFLLDVAPGVIKEFDDIDIDKSRYGFDEVSLSNVSVQSSVLLSDQLFFKRSAFSEEPATIGFRVGSLTEVQEAVLTLFIEDGVGELNIHLNEKPVFSSAVYPDGYITVPLSLEDLKSGFNELRFSVTGPGMSFWSTNYYFLSSVNIVTRAYSVTESVEEQAFILEEKDLDDALRAVLTGSVSRLSVASAMVTILLNDNLLYEADIEGRGNLNIPVPLQYLSGGINRLKWMVGTDGAYKFTFVRLTLHTLPLEETKFYAFDISPKDWKRIRAVKLPQDIPAYECELNMTRSVGGKTISVRVNSQSYIRTFDEGDKVSFNVCEALSEGPNTISLNAEETVALEGLTLELKNL